MMFVIEAVYMVFIKTLVYNNVIKVGDDDIFSILSGECINRPLMVENTVFILFWRGIGIFLTLWLEKVRKEILRKGIEQPYQKKIRHVKKNALFRTGRTFVERAWSRETKKCLERLELVNWLERNKASLLRWQGKSTERAKEFYRESKGSLPREKSLFQITRPNKSLQLSLINQVVFR